MNRLDELNSMLEESGKMPEALNMDTIRKGTKKRVFRHRVVTAARNVAIAAVALMGTLTIGVNTSDVFASTVKNIPLIGNIAVAVDFNKGVEDAFNVDYGIAINQKVKGKYAELEVAYVMADERSVAMLIRATDDGGKYKGNLAVEKMIDADTGEEITAGYTLPNLKTDGEYVTLFYDWGHYHKNIDVTLTFKIWDDNYECVDSENYNYKFGVGEKLEPRMYEVNQDYDIGGAKYHIGQVRLYPMSTEVDLEYLNDDEFFTTYLGIELVDENGQVRGIPINGNLGRETDGKYSTLLQGGYFAYEGDLKLCITRAELLPVDRMNVTLNLDTLKFTDSRGELDEITDVHWDEDFRDSIWFKLNPIERTYQNTFDYYFDENGDIQMLEQGWTNEYAIIPMESVNGEKTYINENNEIKLLRHFPDTIIDTDIEIELK